MTQVQKARVLEHLRTASVELAKATQYLDVTEEKCKECKLNVRTSQSEWKAHTELTAARAKVQKWLETLMDLSTKEPTK